MKLIGLFAASVILAGCASKQYFHTSITNQVEIERRLQIDDAECTQISVGSVPGATSRYIPPESYRHQGTISGYRSDGTYSNYSYSGTSSAGGSFSRGYAIGAQAGDDIATGMARRKIHHACMLSRGWTDNQAQAAVSKMAKTEEDARLQASQKWEETIEQFLATQTAQPGGIDYRNDGSKLMLLDRFVKQLANDPKNSDKPMLWFLMEADKIVKKTTHQNAMD